MTTIQVCSLIFTVALPPLLWAVGRRCARPWYDQAVRRGLASVLILTYLGDLACKIHDRQFVPEIALPMQLCDWTLFAVAAALWWGWRAGFELGYFWGLGGTLQARLGVLPRDRARGECVDRRQLRIPGPQTIDSHAA
ncbi:MAG: YwaF family protein [Verrucomicrobiaceae bacterium]|nr:YwaF family protein [Verrucomicrobiaceae bacterium]